MPWQPEQQSVHTSTWQPKPRQEVSQVAFAISLTVLESQVVSDTSAACLQDIKIKLETTR
jgi:hypothetical protein